jgi:hypothetical protein
MIFFGKGELTEGDFVKRHQREKRRFEFWIGFIVTVEPLSKSGIHRKEVKRQ